MESFKPSQVFLNTVPPLVGTMKHSECEHAAALIVRVCQVRGDKWAPVSPRELGETITADLDAKVEPWVSLDKNPFFRPNFHALIEEGFARWSEAEGGPLEFTDKGIEARRR